MAKGHSASWTDPDTGKFFDYGFQWTEPDSAPVSVTRMMEYRGYKVLCIETDHAKIIVDVSPKGRAMTVYGTEGKIKFVEVKDGKRTTYNP